MTKYPIRMIVFIVIFMAFISLLAIPIYAIDISNCTFDMDSYLDPILNQSNSIYYLTSNVSVSSMDYCFYAGASNITLDCQNHLVQNDLSGGSIGFYDTGFNNITVKNCILSGWTVAIDFISCSNNTVFNNIITDNTNGINLDGASNISIHDNIIANSSNYGFKELDYSTGDIIYNNFFNNSANLNVNDYVDDSWNVTKQSGTRIYSTGTEIGGNYYANPSGTGYSQVSDDVDANGFCDLSYDIMGDGSGGYDYLPLSNNYSCVPSLSCGSWSLCVNSTQSRNCSDGCGNDTIENQSCTMPTNYTELDENHTSYVRCLTNDTRFVSEWSAYDGVYYHHNNTEWCDNGCDDTTSTCAPSKAQANLILFGVIVSIVIIGLVFMRLARR